MKRPARRSVTPRKAVKRSPRDGETTYREIFDATNDGIVVHDAETGRVRDVNKAMLRMYGWRSKKDVIAGNMDELGVYEPLYTRAEALRRMHLAASGNPQVFEWPAKKSDGTAFWVEVSLRSSRIDEEETVLAVVRDITERKRTGQAIRESEERFRSIVETTAEWIWEMDVNGRHTFSNPGVTAILGYRPEEFVGQAAVSLLHAEDRSEVEVTLSRLMAQKRGWRGWVLRWRHKDGSYRFLESNAEPILDSTGEVRGYRGTDRDITERKRAEEALRESESIFRQLWEATVEGIVIHDKGVILEVNNAMCRMFGVAREQVVGKSLLDFTPADSRDLILAHVASGSEEPFETPAVRADGTRLTIEVFPKQILYRGKSVRMVANRDITERKQAEKALRESEDIFRNFMEHSPIYVFFKDQNIRATRLSRNYETMLGRPIGELLGKNMDDLFPSDLAKSMVADDMRILREGKRVEVEEEFNGRCYSTIKFPIKVEGKPPYLAGFTIDITERKQAEKALRENEERFRALIEHSHDAVTMLSADGTVLYDSPSIARVLGYDPTERLGRRVFEFVHPEERQKMAQVFAGFAQQAGAVAASEVRFIHKDGTPRWIEGVRTNLLHEPTVRSIVVNYRDITERKRAEEALANERSLLRIVIESIPDPIYVKDLQGRKTLANSAEARFCGKTTVEEILGRTDTELYPADMAGHTREEEEQLLRSVSGLTKFERRFVLVDGTEHWMIGNKITLRDTKGIPIGILGVSHDITERKRIEEERQRLDHQIQQAQKLESLGLLAGGIAHDFNNLLSGIFGYVELAKTSVDTGHHEKASEQLSKAMNVFSRARDLSRQLITFSKGGAPVKKPGDIGATLSETVQFALSGSNVKGEYSIAAGLWTCSYDANQISQVIDNIVINAKHAMPNGGLLEVSASNAVIEMGSGVALPGGHYIKISVKDHGIGIPREYLQKIFDPFFTTKHSGSGLGLATCWSIVKRHDGTIVVESEPGKGSTFHVYLPAAHDLVTVDGSVSSTSFVGQGRILVMDDEEHIREILEEMLTELGYTVQTANDGAQAIELFKKASAEGSPFDIVIVDLTIPGGMGGRETLSKLVELEKTVRVIASSGYSEDPVMSSPQNFGFAASIRKPYRITDLVESIVNAIAAKRR